MLNSRLDNRKVSFHFIDKFWDNFIRDAEKSRQMQKSIVGCSGAASFPLGTFSLAEFRMQKVCSRSLSGYFRLNEN